MYCKHRDNLVALLDGELNLSEVERLRAHLQSCRQCREHLELLKRSYDALELVEPVELPEGLGDRIRSGVRKRSLLPVFAAAAAAVLLAGAVFVQIVISPSSEAPVQGAGGVDVAVVEELTTEELAVIENMEMLEDYEILSDFELLAQFETLEEFEDFPAVEAI